MTKTIIAPLLATALALTPALAGAAPHSHHYQRSRRVTEEFQRLNPCPSTGKTYGACPGWIKDHIVALCKGGADAVWNMQWQTVAEAKAKDKWECK
ncbi:MAG TPA: HNH endonuclease signature motif containing protein [Dongiaceae bacterium]|nr:HNH endonuclease signature motif containing protein [Dongiaceae bacterium]